MAAIERVAMAPHHAEVAIKRSSTVCISAVLIMVLYSRNYNSLIYKSNINFLI